MKIQFPRRNLSPRLRKTLAPGKDFADKTKARFLAEFDAHHGANAYTPRFTMASWSVGLAFILIIIATTFGTSVYADAKNVPADSVLYPFKRLNESVVLDFASPEQKMQLEATFASRRADEIQDLQERNPSSTLLTRLSDDLGANITASANILPEQEQEEGHGDGKDSSHGNGNFAHFCAGINSAIAASSSLVQAILSGRADAVTRLEAACATNAASSSTTTVIIKDENSGHGDREDGGEKNTTSTNKSSGSSDDDSEHVGRLVNASVGANATTTVLTGNTSTSNSDGNGSGEEQKGDGGNTNSGKGDGGSGSGSGDDLTGTVTSTVSTTASFHL